MYTVEVSHIIDAPAAAIYATLADYRVSHPAILPKEFTGLQVEQGGTGAGTVFNAHISVMGAKRSFHMVVSEPQPGRVLAETDEAAGVSTTFTVEPLGAAQSRVTIASLFRESAGIKGWLEKLTNPGITRRMYHDELDNIAAYMKTHSSLRG